jgi:hypothetical protein
MKITVIKKSGVNTNMASICPWIVDEPPVAKG